MTRIICISDTHNQILADLPDGDILIHAGDWTGRGTYQEVNAFAEWVKQLKQKYSYVVLVAGNHDFLAEKDPGFTRMMLEGAGAIYLEDQAVTIEGIKFFGSPVSPRFFDWAFNRDRGEDIKRHWDMIPDDVEVLITHGPAYGIGDLVTMRGSPNKGEHVGCKDLLDTINNRLKNLTLQVFGHIHSGYGAYDIGGVLHANAAILNDRYNIANEPIVVEFRDGKPYYVI